MAAAPANNPIDISSAPILDCENVTVAFPQYGAAASIALRDVSLSLRTGEVLGLVGESGSGKTMLARAIMRLIPPPGEIMEIADREVFFDDPQHPYTVLLLAAFAQNERLRRYWLGEDKVRENRGPSATGCSFQNRCVRVQERCRSDHPALVERQPGHLVRCHYPVERP